jgi:hypothetical protein
VGKVCGTKKDWVEDIIRKKWINEKKKVSFLA